MKTILHKFVEFIPNFLDNGILYISIEYRTAVHLCMCGCGNKVVTPITPTDWQLTFDGKSVSLSPSIGNWNFECQSHYFIKKNQILILRSWNNSEIANGRNNDFKKKRKYFSSKRKT